MKMTFVCFSVNCLNDGGCANGGNCLATGVCECPFRMVGTQCTTRMFSKQPVQNCYCNPFNTIKILYFSARPFFVQQVTLPNGFCTYYMYKTSISRKHSLQQILTFIAVDCTRSPCFNGATCEEPGTCVCAEGFSGTFCHQPDEMPMEMTTPAPTPPSGCAFDESVVFLHSFGNVLFCFSRL